MSNPDSQKTLVESLTDSLESEATVAPESPALTERGVVLIAALGHFICHLSELVYAGVALAVMAEFSLEPSTAVSLAVLGWILLGAGAIPVGMWSDAWGPLRVFRWYFALTALAAGLVALSANVWMLFISLTLLGLTASIYHPVGLALLSVGVKERGRAMGVNGVAGNVGIALGPALGLAFGFRELWRIAFAIVAVLSLIALGVYLWLTRKAKRVNIVHGPTDAINDGKAHGRNLPFRSMIPLILLYAAMVCGGFNYRFLMTATPYYVSGKSTVEEVKNEKSGKAKVEEVQKVKGGWDKSSILKEPRFDAAAAGKIFLVLLIGAVGQFAGGWMSDRFGAKYVYPSLIVCVVPIAFLVGSIGEGGWVILPACILAACMFGQQPVENSVLAERTSHGRRGLSYAAKFTLTFGIGALGASIAGFVWQYASLNAVYYMIAGSAVLMACLAALALLRNDRAT